MGTIGTSWISKSSLECEKRSDVHIRGIISNACWVCRRTSAGSTPNSRHSGAVDLVSPNSSRPPLRWSSIAARSAALIGWLNRAGAGTAAWPSLILDVCCEIAAGISSGADDRLNSSAPWCSTCHQQARLLPWIRRTWSAADDRDMRHSVDCLTG